MLPYHNKFLITTNSLSQQIPYYYKLCEGLHLNEVSIDAAFI